MLDLKGKTFDEQYIGREYGWLEGKIIKSVRPFTTTEKESYGWDGSEVPFVIIFTDNTYIIPMSDDEGNGAGALDYKERVG
jgi:hypothetical protein